VFAANSVVTPELDFLDLRCLIFNQHVPLIDVVLDSLKPSVDCFQLFLSSKCHFLVALALFCRFFTIKELTLKLSFFPSDQEI
jgi:hypothetical protein